MPNLALFDFDGTVTTADTFTPFIRYAIEPRRMMLGKVILAPLILAYKLGWIHASPLRSSIIWFAFCGKAEEEICRLGASYSAKHLPRVVRPKALERIKWHQSRGDTVALVSASLDIYLRDWCKQHNVDLICSEVECRGGVVTGRYRGGDCTGEAKAIRIRQKYNLSQYPIVYAYGDTTDDEPMLNLASKKYFRWQEVTDLNAATASYATGKSDPNKEERLKQMAEEDAWLDRLVATHSTGGGNR